MLYWLVPLLWFLGFVGFAHLYIQLYPTRLPQYANPKLSIKVGVWALSALWPVTLLIALPISAMAWGLSLNGTNPFQFGAVYQREAERSASEA